MKANELHKKTAALCVVMTAVVWIGLASGGSLNPSAPPTGGTMKPLDDVEPRTAIHQSDIPLTISTPGSYYLAENLSYTANSACINVTANDVTIDLCGFAIDGGGTGNYGVYLPEVVNVEIRNGTIYDFEMGIIVPASSTVGSQHRVLNVQLLSCSDAGVFFRYRDHCQVRDCTVANGAQTGYCVIVGDNGIVSGNIIYSNSVSSAVRPYGVFTGNNCTITGNVINGNGTSTTADYAGGIYCAANCTVTGNTVRNNGNSAGSATVYGIHTGNSCIVKENICYGNGNSAGNTVYGISSGSGSTLLNNTVYDNGDNASATVYGIFNGGGSTIANNTVYGNGTGAVNTVNGVYGGTGSTVTGNTCHSNGGSASGIVYGIRGLEGCTLSGNTSYGNGGSSQGTYVYGLYAGSGSSVIGNTSRSNGIGASGSVYGIYLAGYNLVNNNTAYGNEDTNMNTSATSSYGTNVPQLP
jgi:hypothetical protein